jgi:hypothetical protein
LCYAVKLTKWVWGILGLPNCLGNRSDPVMQEKLRFLGSDVYADDRRSPIAAELGQAPLSKAAGNGWVIAVLYPAMIPMVSERGMEASRKPATPTCDESLSRQSRSYRRTPGVWYGLPRRQESISEEVKEIAQCAKTPAQALIGIWTLPAGIGGRSSQWLPVSCQASSGM